MEGVLSVILIFGGATLFLLSVSPVGRAFADRLRGGQPGPDPELVADVDALRRELAELSERVDFTERLLLQADERGRDATVRKEQGGIGPGGSAV